MKRRDFVEALREAERARGELTLSPFAERRIRRAVEDRPGRTHRWYLPLGVGALAAAAAVALVVRVASPQGSDAPLAFAQDGTVTFEREGLPLRDAQLGVTVRGLAGAKIARTEGGIRMLEGTAEFDVDPRAPGQPPFVVYVSHGYIEVLGTRFTVVQHTDGGEVRLHEGRIRFLDSMGRADEISAGQWLSWPAAKAEAVQPDEPAQIAGAAPPPPAATARPGTELPRPFDVEAFIHEINALRQKGAFAEAASRLERALRRPLPAATHERLSYELGSILTSQLRDTPRACKVWQAHRERHPEGRYAAEVSRAEADLSCP